MCSYALFHNIKRSHIYYVYGHMLDKNINLFIQNKLFDTRRSYIIDVFAL